MPTINQLVRKPRQTANNKSKSPALGRIHNALKVRYYNQDAPLKRGVCVKVTTKKLILEEPFYDVEQNKTLIYGIEANGEYDVSNNYLRMHGIPVARRVAGRKGVRKHER